MKQPVRVAVTGAAGQIGYSILFRIASGAMLGADQPVILQLLEITPALKALGGVVMELNDCAFPLLAGVVTSDDPMVAFAGADYALLVGALPRKAGMERSDLLSANGGIFKPQGEALSAVANKGVKVLVVGNPANTNALIAKAHAPNLDNSQIHAMTRLDHNRAMSQLAAKTGKAITDVKKMTIWGNHSTTQFPDLYHCELAGQSAYATVNDHEWYEKTFIPTVAKRGAAIIEARGSSSAASAANAAIEHMKTWAFGTPEGDWTSMAIVSDGSYGVPAGLVFSYPVTVKDGKVSIVQGLDINEFSRAKLDATAKELVEERDAVRQLGFVS